jgi:NYN domain
MNANYFFIDGSALTAQIRQLQRAEPAYRERKLCPRAFLSHFMMSLYDLHGGSYKRATFYFPQGDEAAVEGYLRMPDHQHPGEVRDLHFKFCGHKLKKSAEFDKFVEESVPTKFQSRFTKSEKGIDIEICCDALRLAAAARLERLFLLTNDGDFIPLCRTLKEFGANVSILHLSAATAPNAELLREADSYNVVLVNALDAMFFPLPVEGGLVPGETFKGEVSSAAGEPASEKPDTEPSDLRMAEDPHDPEKEA